MGKNRFSSAAYAASAASRKSAGVDDFDYSKTAKATGKYDVHDSLNIAGKMRVSRDIDGRNRKTPIIVGFDVTGSMSIVPQQFQAALPQLLGLLEYKKYCTDPDICVAAFGDVTCDYAPVQIGSFEGDNAIDEQLRNIILVGGGGGQNSESPEMILAFAAYRTKHDAMDKRGEKGYLFIASDECGRTLDRDAYNSLFSPEEALLRDVKFAEVLEDARKLYNVFFILPKGASNSTNSEMLAFWHRHFDDEHFLKLAEAKDISQLVAATIGMMEGSVDWASVKKDLTDAGGDLVMIGSIEKAVKSLPAKAVGAPTSGLPTSKSSSTIKRLKA